MLGGRPTEEWIARYSASHQNPVNRFCHTVGIPMIVASIALFAAGLWRTALVFFITGWVFQFVGHAFDETVIEEFALAQIRIRDLLNQRLAFVSAKPFTHRRAKSPLRFVEHVRR